MTKPFILILAITIILGGSIGGAFVGGIAVGKNQGDDTVTPVSAATGGQDSQLNQTGLGLPDRDQLRQRIQSGDLSQQDFEQLRQRFASGDLSQEELARLREGFTSGGTGQQDLGQAPRQGQGGAFGGGAFGGTGGRGFAGRTGAIEQVEGNTLTVSTEEGTLQAIIGADTTIQLFTEATLADLTEGMRVTVIGQEGEDGTVQALSIIVVPEGQEGLFGGGFTPRGGR